MSFIKIILKKCFEKELGQYLKKTKLKLRFKFRKLGQKFIFSSFCHKYKIYKILLKKWPNILIKFIKFYIKYIKEMFWKTDKSISYKTKLQLRFKFRKSGQKFILTRFCKKI